MFLRNAKDQLLPNCSFFLCPSSSSAPCLAQWCTQVHCALCLELLKFQSQPEALHGEGTALGVRDHVTLLLCFSCSGRQGWQELDLLPQLSCPEHPWTLQHGKKPQQKCKGKEKAQESGKNSLDLGKGFFPRRKSSQKKANSPLGAVCQPSKAP